MKMNGSSKGFVFNADPWVNKQIEAHMNDISTEVLRTFRGNVTAIILAGGFGRGEGSIAISSNGVVTPLKDYDLYVVSDVKITQKAHFDMIQRIHAKIGADTSWYFSVAPGSFNVDIQVIQNRKLSRLSPDISTIDLKYGSKIIYGEDIRNQIPFALTEIVASSGAIVLFNKVIGLLEQLNPSFLVKGVPDRNRISMIYECGKTYVEICTALNILSHKYVASYNQRADQFSKFFADFTELKMAFPDLPEKVSYFTNLKLTSKISDFKGDPIGLWFETRRYLVEIISYYARVTFGVKENSDLIEFTEEMYNRMGLFFFNEYLHFNLRRFKFYRRTFLPTVSFIAQIYDNLVYMQRIWGVKKRLYWKTITDWRSPLIKVFCAAFLTLCAIDSNGEVNRKLLEKAKYYLSRSYLTISGTQQELSNILGWDNCRRACVEGQKLYERVEKISI
jgi:hypothetical protein